MTPLPDKPTPSHDDLVRQRQRSRAVVTALLLGALVVLTFAIGLVRMMRP